MKKWLVLSLTFAALACGGGEGDSVNPPNSGTDGGSGGETAGKGLWIDAELGGLVLKKDNKVSSSLEVMRDTTHVNKSATLTVNGVEITKDEGSDTFDWWLFGQDIGASPGIDLEVVAKEGSDTATLKVTCPANVELGGVSGLLTPGQKVTVNWTGSVGGYPDAPRQSWVGLVACDADGSHESTRPGALSTATLTGSETSVELVVPDDNDQAAYLVRLYVIGNQVETDQGIGFCQMVREKVIVTADR